jgi:RNA polymerase sigma-70 factor (ECF subfamily)
MAAPVLKKKQQKRGPTSSANVVHPLRFQGDDETLIHNMTLGQPHAFQAFYHRHISFVYAVLLRTLGDDAELEIMIQEVFTKAFQNIHTLQDSARVKSWLASIAVHTARDTIKHRKRIRRRFVFFEPSEMPEPPRDSDDIGDKEAVSAVYRLLDTLGVDARIAFTLRYINEMELTEVAEACNVSQATIKRRLAKAKRQFCALAKADSTLKEWVKEGMGHSGSGLSREWGEK